jgi:hypothetical protein
MVHKAIALAGPRWLATANGGRSRLAAQQRNGVNLDNLREAGSPTRPQKPLQPVRNN